MNTTVIYAHLDPDHLAGEIGRLSYVAPVGAATDDLAEARCTRMAMHADTWRTSGELGHPANGTRSRVGCTKRKSPGFPGLTAVGATGFEPATPSPPD